MKLIKNIFLISLIILFISCKSGLEKNYEEASKENDLKEISTKISTEEFTLLKDYIIILEQSDENLNDKTYQRLLDETRNKEYARLEEIRRKKQKKEDRIETENLNKEILEKKERLCNKKWKINEYALLILIPDDSSESIQLGTDILNKAMFIKDSELTISLVKEKHKTYVKGLFDKKLTNFMSNNNKRTKEYFNDGTYKITYGKETQKGTWEFVDANRIREQRPSETSYRKKKAIFFVDIKDLNTTTFNFNENEYNSLNYGQLQRTYTYIAMSL